MRKGRNGEWKMEKNGGKIMTFIVATDVVVSRPPERRPTGTPTARANFPTPGNSAQALISLYICSMQV